MFFFYQIKNSIIDGMFALKPTTLGAVSQVSSVLNKVTEELKGISIASQVCCQNFISFKGVYEVQKQFSTWLKCV